MFRVVPDQLRVSEGWVRCGQCSEIFDATQNMVPPTGSAAAAQAPEQQPRAAAAATPSTASTPPPSSPDPLPQKFPTQELPAQERPAVATTANTHTMPVARIEPTPAPYQPINTVPTPNADRVILTASGTNEPIWADAPLTDPQTALIAGYERDAYDLPSPAAPPKMAPAAAARFESPTSEKENLSFLQDKPKPSFWQSRTTRIVLWLVLLALLVALAVQIVVSQRDRIAALEPATQPMLLALCAWQGCTVAPLRQIESIVIDSSSFSRIRGDDYRLGFALKNKAPIDIAMPAIELALTDPQDQPVIRRVIHPAEFGAASDRMAGGSMWNGAISLNVKPGANGERIAGYRLLAFYP